jgi:hypothetical protein
MWGGETMPSHQFGVLEMIGQPPGRDTPSLPPILRHRGKLIAPRHAAKHLVGLVIRTKETPVSPTSPRSRLIAVKGQGFHALKQPHAISSSQNRPAANIGSGHYGRTASRPVPTPPGLRGPDSAQEQGTELRPPFIQTQPRAPFLHTFSPHCPPASNLSPRCLPHAT